MLTLMFNGNHPLPLAPSLLEVGSVCQPYPKIHQSGKGSILVPERLDSTQIKRSRRPIKLSQPSFRNEEDACNFARSARYALILIIGHRLLCLYYLY